MQLYLFWSTGDPGLFALTIDPEGEILPAELGPWEPNKNGGPLPSLWDGQTGPIERRILAEGFYLVRSQRLAAVARASLPRVQTDALDLEGAIAAGPLHSPFCW
jgi:hypothetical protein